MGSSQDLSLKVVLTAQNLAGSALGSLGKMLSNLSGPAGMAAKGMLAIASAAVAFTAASVQMAAQYDQSLRMVQSLTNQNSAQMAQYDSQLKTLAIDAGVAPNALAQGLYQIISSGAKGASVMQELTLATRDSKIGMVSAATTAEALTNVLANFSWQTKDANLVNGIMLETVTLGKATFQQYASTITKASSVAAQFHIGLQTMSAAWATMTASGIRAAQASTDFQQVAIGMYSKIGTITKSLEKNGIAFNEAKFNSASFRDKILMLNAALEEARKKHVTVTGVTVQASAAIQAIASHIDAYDSNLKQLSDKQAMGNKTAQAWAITQQGFAQTLSRVGAAVQVLMITIGQALLPVLTRAAQTVLPVISSFTTWLIKSGALQTGLNALVGGVKGVIGFVAKLVEGGAALVNFFKNNQVAALSLLIPLGVLGAVMVNLAVGAIAGFIASLPELIAGWALWAAGAWTAAAGTIAATWPVLAIGAAIGALIAIIILLWTHWSQVTKWLQGAWKSFTDWLGNSLHAVGQFFVNLWSGITTGAGNFFSGLGSLVHAGLMAVLNFFLSPFRAIGALFSWLYQHNVYVKKLIDTITHIVTTGLNIIHTLWQVAINWLTGLWNGLKDRASQAWNNLKTAIMAIILVVATWLYEQWTKISTWLMDKWNSFKDLASKAWQAVSGVFSSIWNKYIAGPLGSLWNNFTSWFGNLGKQALQWGSNLINQFIQGIKNMAGGVVNAVQNVASSVAKFLGFHSPTKEGPGSQSHKWAPALVDMFSRGLMDGQPKIQAALNAMVSPMLMMNHPPALSGSVPYGRPPAGNSYSNYAGGGNHYGDIIVHAPAGMNIKQLADEIERRRDRKFRSSGVMGNPAYGARNS